jgi:hypothetical protein
MKAAFAALLLLFQLQPVLGSVACLGLPARATQQDCKMPDHGQPPATSIAVSGVAAQSCPLIPRPPVRFTLPEPDSTSGLLIG